jgi:uncharacterized protein (DUF362 family)
MEKDKISYQPSPAEIRKAEALMSVAQRELTEVREDALFEGRRQALEERNNETVENGQGEATNAVNVDGVLKQTSESDPEDPKPSSPEVIHDFQNIPKKNGIFISGYVESENDSSVIIMTSKGSIEIDRSELLHHDTIYSRGYKADIDRLHAHEQDEARKKLEEQKGQSERKEIFKDIEKELVFVAHGEGCVGNINRSFADFAHQHQELLEGIRGKKVLIKINAVDPSSPDACTSSESLRATIENLLQYGPAEICIGDQPADQFMNGPDGKKIGSQELFRQFREKLGYDFLGEYPGVRFIDFRSELQVPDPERPEDARMYDLSEFQTIFSLSLPKAHGQLDFTGCRKNIVGLLPQAERNALLHPHGDSMLGWLDRNTPAMQRISDTYTARNPRTVYVMDGFKTIMGHEHEGVPRVSDFAIVSMDPYNADLLASTLSFSPNVTQAVEYLHKIPILENADKIEGSVPESANKSFNERRVVYAGQTAEGKPGGAMYAITDPEIEETTIKSIEERLELVKNLESIDNFDEVIKNLRISGSDRAIKCLLRISELTNDTNLLITIFYSVYLPIVSSRGLSSEYSNNVIPNEQLANDELLKRFASFEKRIMDLGIRL